MEINISHFQPSLMSPVSQNKGITCFIFSLVHLCVDYSCSVAVRTLNETARHFMVFFIWVVSLYWRCLVGPCSLRPDPPTGVLVSYCGTTRFSGRLCHSPDPSLTRKSLAALSFFLPFAFSSSICSWFSIFFIFSSYGPLSPFFLFLSSLLNLSDYLKLLIVPLTSPFTFDRWLGSLAITASVCLTGCFAFQCHFPPVCCSLCLKKKIKKKS